MKSSINSLPKYDAKEEKWNVFTHLFGFFIGVAITIFFICYQTIKQISFSYMWPFYSYAFFMLLMFMTSSLYHSRKLNSKSRAIFRIIDHCDIYAFISATYIPFCLYGINNWKMGIIIIATNCSISILAIILNIININSKTIKIISIILYIFNGWMILLFNFLNIQIDSSIFAFLLAGGIAYTIGSILYGIGHHKKWFHAIFHFFVLIGVVLQFGAILLLLIR